MKRIAVYSGTFDPFTLGHLWIVQEAQSLFDEVHVVIAGHPKKSPHFNLRTRSHMMTHALEKMERVQCYVLQEDNI
ncbi:adenylyltransferase/cytidyltransferase family protein, partial [Enterococcus faecium]|uniref:adenylyltransferase/cytidyltransferase family protein n=1 Tax=Enterococcus faecium TaxID=1352 RepID=UPI003F41C5CA